MTKMKTFLKLTLPAFCLIFLCAGCPGGMDFGGKTVVAKVKLAVIPMPERPKLAKLSAAQLTEYEKLSPETRAVLEGNNDALMGYAKQCEEGLHDYNAYSRLQNESSLEFVTGEKGK